MVAITLLVVEIHLPGGLERPSGHDLVWPSYVAYVDSFPTIGIM